MRLIQFCPMHSATLGFTPPPADAITRKEDAGSGAT
eukprot:gene24274-50483_t